jgi:hypothetical protein
MVFYCKAIDLKSLGTCGKIKYPLGEKIVDSSRKQRKLKNFREEEGAMVLDDKLKSTMSDAARKLTGYRKRDFMAKVAEDYLQGSARKAERVLGWNRSSVQLGLEERRSGLICVSNYQARGRRKTEVNQPQLEAELRSLVDEKAQADPSFKSVFCYARISASAVRVALIEERGYPETALPSRQTIGEMLNRCGYRLKKHKKPNP